MIVDAQVHIWEANSVDRPWLPGRVASSPSRFTIEKLLPRWTRRAVDRVVIVPPSWEGDRNDYALEAVRCYPERFAVIGRLSLASPKTAALLPHWKKEPGMLGIRVTFHAPQWRWPSDGTADWSWPEAEKFGIPGMFYGAPMAPFAHIAERHAELTLIALSSRLLA